MIDNKYKIYPRSKVENLVLDFIEEHKIYAQYGKDSEGLFNVQFVVEEEIAKLENQEVEEWIIML